MPKINRHTDLRSYNLSLRLCMKPCARKPTPQVFGCIVRPESCQASVRARACLAHVRAGEPDSCARTNAPVRRLDELRRHVSNAGELERARTRVSSSSSSSAASSTLRCSGVHGHAQSGQSRVRKRRRVLLLSRAWRASRQFASKREN